MGSVIKTVTFYEKAFWREKGFNGVLISDSSPAYVTVDDTKPDGSYPAIMRLVIIPSSTFLTYGKDLVEGKTRSFGLFSLV